MSAQVPTILASLFICSIVAACVAFLFWASHVADQLHAAVDHLRRIRACSETTAEELTTMGQDVDRIEDTLREVKGPLNEKAEQLKHDGAAKVAGAITEALARVAVAARKEPATGPNPNETAVR